MSKRRSMDFKEKEELIQSYANKHTNGNFTKAVNKMIDKVLGLDKLDKAENNE